MPRGHHRRRRTLQELAQLEEELLDVVWSAAGDAVARDLLCQRAGVYRRYATLFRVYVRRSGDGVEGSEALRRATFLLWCGASLPNCLTGVDELPERDQEELIGYLDSLCADGALDHQLRWMLPYYHAQYPAAFGRHSTCGALQRFLTASSGGEWRLAEPEPRHFAGRGLMGYFWTQVVQAG